MIRFAVSPAGELVPDIEERLPGRGLWIAARRDIVAAASGDRLSRALKARVVVPDDLADRVASLLQRRALDLLGLARRAGQAVTGHDRVHDWIRSGRAGLLVVASDASPDARAKMEARGGVPVVDGFDRLALGRVFGRDQAVHVAVAPGRLADGLLLTAKRFAGLRVDDENDNE